MFFTSIGVLLLYDMAVVQKALCGAYITSRLGIKKFLWVTSIGASRAGAHSFR
jgi:hypothetical protein